MSRRHGDELREAPRRCGDEPREVPRQRVTLTVQQLVDGRTAGASELRSASHIGSTWVLRHVSFQDGLVIFMFQHAARPEAFMTTQLMRMELH